ncbi:MAG: hypothetical protein F6K44_04595 [Moorea sp. SIO3E2]|nr:hypothetical protein [Moorena sp. SIO3E2]
MKLARCQCLDAVAHGGNHGSCSWGEPRQSLMGRGCVRNLRPHLVSPVETPKTALPPQDRTASPRPRCIASTPDAHSTGALSVMASNPSPLRKAHL